MANMSYCRFENTLADLQDCYDAMQNQKPKNLSKSEQIARNELIELCREICENYEVEEVQERVYEDEDAETDADNTVINAENWREAADELDYDFGRNQVFDFLSDNSLVVVTEMQKGHVTTEYKFSDELTHDECRELAKKMTMRLCNHYTPQDIKEIIEYAWT